jgi:hypothetical protein
MPINLREAIARIAGFLLSKEVIDKDKSEIKEANS